MTEKEIERLLRIVANELDIDPLKKTRQQQYVEARTIIMKILRSKGLGVRKIADTLDKNHASVIHHLKNFDFQLQYDKELNKKYETILLKMAKGNNIIYQLSHDELIKYTFSLEERLKKIILSNNRNKNYENLFKFIERNIPESNLIEAKQRLKDLTDGLYN
jgi:hypothetical protein